MITTLPTPTEHATRASVTSTVAARPAPDSAAAVVPGTGERPWLPYALGVLLGLLVVLALAAWALLMLNGADYSGVVDLSQVIQP